MPEHYTGRSIWGTHGVNSDTVAGRDIFLDGLAAFCKRAGLTIKHIYPSSIIRQVVPIGHFVAGFENEFAISLNGIKVGIVVDELPAGYSGPLPVLAVTGLHADEYVTNAFLKIAIESVWPWTNPPFGSFVSPPTVTQPSFIWYASIYPDEAGITGNYEYSTSEITFGGALGAFAQSSGGGGWLIKTQDEKMSVYFTQFNEFPSKLQIRAQRNVTVEQWLPYINGSGTDIIHTNLHKEPGLLYANPYGLFIGVTDGAEHVCMFSLDLSANVGPHGEANTVTECAWANLGPMVFNFQNSLKDWGSPAYILLNGSERITQPAIGVGQPALRVARSANLRTGKTVKWATGVAHLGEAWVNLSARDQNDEGAIVGKLWDSVVSTSQFTEHGSFRFDDKVFRNLTIGNIDGIFTPGGSLCFVDDEA